MRVVKKGVAPADKLFGGNCNQCDSELEANRGELRIEFDQKEGGEFGVCTCPVCGFDAILYPKK